MLTIIISVINQSTGDSIPATSTNYVWLTDTKETSLSAKLNGNFDAFGREHKLLIGADYRDYESKATQRIGTSSVPLTGVVINWDGSYPEPQWGDQSLSNDFTTKEQALYGSTQFQLTDALARYWVLE